MSNETKESNNLSENNLTLLISTVNSLNSIVTANMLKRRLKILKNIIKLVLK
jgi:hypothetical protein